MPGLKSVTHVSDTSVTYVSGLYTREGRGNRSGSAKISRVIMNITFALFHCETTTSAKCSGETFPQA
jgi:hypothetical protein